MFAEKYPEFKIGVHMQNRIISDYLIDLFCDINNGSIITDYI